MGVDGAHGLLRIRGAGKRTVGHNEAASVVYGMPKIASRMLRWSSVTAKKYK